MLISCVTTRVHLYMCIWLYYSALYLNCFLCYPLPTAFNRHLSDECSGQFSFALNHSFYSRKTLIYSKHLQCNFYHLFWFLMCWFLMAWYNTNQLNYTCNQLESPYGNPVQFIIFTQYRLVQ